MLLHLALPLLSLLKVATLCSSGSSSSSRNLSDGLAVNDVHEYPFYYTNEVDNEYRAILLYRGPTSPADQRGYTITKTNLLFWHIDVPAAAGETMEHYFLLFNGRVEHSGELGTTTVGTYKWENGRNVWVEFARVASKVPQEPTHFGVNGLDEGKLWTIDASAQGLGTLYLRPEAPF